MANGLSEAPVSYLSMIREERAQRARRRGTLNLFLSHKHQDFAAAEEIQKVLKRRGNTEVFLSEDIAKGDNWQDRIEDQLHDSDWFILLFSGTNEDWSWCNHEAGIFRGMMYPNANRIVVLYPPNINLPEPLKKYQAVKCQIAEVGQQDDFEVLFKNIFGEPSYQDVPPVNPYFAFEDDEARTEARDSIIDAVQRLVVQNIEPNNRLVIRLNRLDGIDPSCFPDDAKILAGSSALRLFNVGVAEFSWRDFCSALDDQPGGREHLDTRFWPVVCDACLASVRRKRLTPIHTIFRAPADDRNYHPVLSQISIAGDNSATFYIDFVQVAVSNQSEVRDQSVARVFTALHLSHRFRWEVIDPFRDADRLRRFIAHQTQSEVRKRNGHKTAEEDGLAAIWERIRLIEVEAQNRGVSDERALPYDFVGDARKHVAEMFDFWQRKRPLLETAQSAGDVTTFAEILTELDPMSVEFIALACEQLSKLVRDDADRMQEASHI